MSPAIYYLPYHSITHCTWKDGRYRDWEVKRKTVPTNRMLHPSLLPCIGSQVLLLLGYSDSRALHFVMTTYRFNITQTSHTHTNLFSPLNSTNLHQNQPSNIGTPQTLGPALRTLLPSLFPSSRDPVLANVVMHGAPVPFSAPLEELMREAAYPDGWVCLIVVLL